MSLYDDDNARENKIKRQRMNMSEYSIPDKEQDYLPKFLHELRKGYMLTITHFIINEMYTNQKGIGESWGEFLRDCTTMQLHALARVCEENPPGLELKCSNPKDHAYYYIGSMYVGVEPDGYTHT